jgi:hypothetical protein
MGLDARKETIRVDQRKWGLRCHFCFVPRVGGLATLTAYSKLPECSFYACNVRHDVISAAPSARNICAPKDPVAREGSKIWEPLDSRFLGFSENPGPCKIRIRLLGQAHARVNDRDVAREIAQESFRCNVTSCD